LNSINEGVITTDQQGHVINLNPTAMRITGWHSDYFQRAIDEIFSPQNDQNETINQIVDSCREKTSVFESEVASLLASRDGQEYWIRFTVTPIISDELISGFIVIFHDVSESRQLLEQIRKHKNLDPITSLLNRQAFRARLGAAIHQAKSSDTEVCHALLLVDLDQFHVVNDNCGHTAGDLLLADVAERISGLVRADDVVARIGGDEFGVLLENCGQDAASRIAHNVLNEVKSYRFSYDGKLFRIGASIGIVLVDDNAESVDKLLMNAGSVVQIAKDQGSNRVEIYDEEQESLARKQDELRWFTKINHALENNRLVLSYQKICPTRVSASETDLHYELLLRMLDDDGSLISPGDFIPAAERYNLMPDIDRWVVKHAFQWIEINQHRARGVSLFSINLSGHSIGDEAFMNYVDECFELHHVPGNKICFEITETMAINNMTNTLRFIERFKCMGCQFSLDDFGTGFSSYGYLKTLPVDFLKIDGSFVSKIANDPVDLAMVKSINEVGHVMNRKTIAEYVENEETMALLREIGVDYAQGYGIESPRLLDGAHEPHSKTGTC
ncbi:MAG: EAL domain-containing protein, partial [Ketobacteraceae bacterium]|nr:EAL domain-containing protein [Ketobacteraceae bacterium]